MLLSTLDIALRAGTVALLLVLAASLLSGFRSVVAGRLAAAFALGSAAHAASYAIGPTLPVSGWHAPHRLQPQRSGVLAQPLQFLVEHLQ